MSRIHIAYLSPMPPAATGIADYSAELLPSLAKHVEVEVFAPEAEGGPGRSPSGIPVRRLRRFEPADFDLTLYQIGNNADFHGDIYRLALAHPGLVVVHEFMLHHLIRGLTLGRSDLDAFGEEMRYAYGETGRRAVEQFLDTGVPVDPWPFPLFERLIDASLGVVVHSHAVRDRILTSRPRARVSVVPHHLAIDDLDPGTDPRRWYGERGVAAGAPVIGVFGFVTPQKRIDVLLEAFREVREKLPEVRLAIVGDVSGFYDVDDLRREAPEGVLWTGRLPKAELLQAMAGCDVAVNLRFPTGGETSGTAIRLLGLGKPLVVSDVGWFSEIPRGCAVSVPVGRGEHEALVAVLQALLAEPGLAAAMGANAARRVRRENSLESSAGGYAEAIRLAIEAPATISRPVPPLVSGQMQFGPRTVSGVARAAADLGWTEDEPALAALAEAGVDLGLAVELEVEVE